jgi:hypothetical protein
MKGRKCAAFFFFFFFFFFFILIFPFINLERVLTLTGLLTSPTRYRHDHSILIE